VPASAQATGHHPLIVNAKWLPYVMTYGAADELVPFTGGVEQVEAFNKPRLPLLRRALSAEDISSSPHRMTSPRRPHSSGIWKGS